MERPNKIPPSILPYIEYIEKKAENNLIQTVNKLNRGLQKQVDFLADELLSDTFKLSLEDDKAVDRFLKILEKADPILKAMDKFEQKANGTQKDDSKKVVKEDGVEQFIKATTISTTT